MGPSTEIPGQGTGPVLAARFPRPFAPFPEVVPAVAQGLLRAR
jgi:hypothetical protein